MLKRALISVYDKTGIVEFAQFLQQLGVELISTGGSYKFLREHGLTVTEVSEVTGGEEMLDGRVKTLHPKIHGGILAMRDNPIHMQTLATQQISPIDMVVVNLYPFFNEVNTPHTFSEIIEFIDIGGPSMLRSAAKSFNDVIVICQAADYNLIKNELQNQQQVNNTIRKQLACKVFNLTAAYDAAISQFLLGEDELPPYLNLSYHKAYNLRYGENPHQQAAYYIATTSTGCLKDFSQLAGKELSFNNLRDMDLAWKLISEFDTIAACGIKHSTPCGVALGQSALEAYTKMYNSDPLSIFGGIVALNHPIDLACAKQMNQTFLEIIMAPEFSQEALAELKLKKNLRLIQINTIKPQDKFEYLSLDGAILAQSVNRLIVDDLITVTKQQVTQEQLADLVMAMKVAKYAKSNAIVIVKDGITQGIGTGQTNRIWATEQALKRAKIGGVLASDAFFPFRDCVDLCAQSGITAIIQPGGSLRDQESIEACNQHSIAMLFSKIRHFKH